MKSMKRKNEGFTIPELVIIIALIGVLLTWLLWNASSVFGFSARECCNKLGAKISATKVDTLGKAKNTGDVYLQLTKDSKDRVWIEEFIGGDSQGKVQISDRRVIVEYELSDGTRTVIGNNAAVGEEASYDFIFNRSTGALVDSTGAMSTLKYFEIIAGSHTYRIEFWPVTGKISY